MKKNKMTMKEEEDDVLRKAKYIVSLETSLTNPNDKSYINCIKYIFTKEFTESTLSLPIKKEEKDSFQYLKCFVYIFDILFSKNEIERNILYQSEILPKLLGTDLFNLMKNLEKLAEGKKLGEFNFDNLIKLVDLKESVNFLFCNYAKQTKNKLYGFLNLYFYYLGYFIQSINTFKLSLYYLLRINDLFKKLDYKEFCPNLQEPNCLNLIKLFFKSIYKEPMEMLTIYSLLIFKYEYIFKDIKNKNIDEAILESSAKKTLNIVNKKTLENKIIFEYIFLEFINNLNNISQGDLIKTQDEKTKIIEQKINGGQVDVLGKDNSEEANDYIDPKKNDINEETDQNKNEIKYESAQSEKIDTNEDKSDDKIFNFEKNIKENENQIEANSSFDGKEKINVDNGSNNNSENGTKETNLSNQSTNGQNENSKNEVSESELNTLLKLESELGTSPEMKKIYEIINKMRSEFQNKISLIETQLKDVQDENKKITETLGHIQLRDKAKNFLKSFNIKLQENDLKKIELGKKKKWDLISEKIKENYKNYQNSDNYEVFCEIIEKSAKAIDEGNKSAHN